MSQSASICPADNSPVEAPCKRYGDGMEILLGGLLRAEHGEVRVTFRGETLVARAARRQEGGAAAAA